jgi:hypothetical protein
MWDHRTFLLVLVDHRVISRMKRSARYDRAHETLLVSAEVALVVSPEAGNEYPSPTIPRSVSFVEAQFKASHHIPHNWRLS